jgi:hypothetical protein
MTSLINLRRKRGGRRRGAQVAPGNESASAIRIPGKLASYNRAHRFVMLDPTPRSIRSDPIADVTLGYPFAIGDNLWFLEMCDLFQEFRIVRVTILYKPLITEVNAQHSSVVASEFQVPDIVYAFHPFSDFPTSFATIKENGAAVVQSSLERFQVAIKPRPLVRVFNTGINDAFMDLGMEWLNTSDPATPHYGFIISIQPSLALGPPTPTFGGRLEFYYTVDFRYPRLSSFLSGRKERIPPPMDLVKQAPAEEKKCSCKHSA